MSTVVPRRFTPTLPCPPPVESPSEHSLGNREKVTWNACFHSEHSARKSRRRGTVRTKNWRQSSFEEQAPEVSQPPRGDNQPAPIIKRKRLACVPPNTVDERKKRQVGSNLSAEEHRMSLGWMCFPLLLPSARASVMSITKNMNICK